MYNIIPLILILISLAIIINIVVRKFSVLAALDIDTIQSERETKFKEQIISNRLKRNYLKTYSKIMKVLRPIGHGIGSSFSYLYKKLLDFKENYNKEMTPKINEQEKVIKLYAEAEDFMKKEEFDEAEKRYIEIIGLDSKNVKAFRSLGKLYFERKDFHEAKQTLGHVLKLLEKNLENVSAPGENTGETSLLMASTYFDMALIVKATDNIDGCLEYINKALVLEPNNPRYLDTKVEISIIKKDKAGALDAYEKLKEANPENNKLEELKGKISEL